ncbi:hypothetical protein GALL_540040 [mine drainage metagenome]|uniref:Uncharacterized protein n=1 Tax=mine drainage metagenome TaxID=410659 RepID=A0A1J5P032_9ZZZZ
MHQRQMQAVPGAVGVGHAAHGAERGVQRVFAHAPHQGFGAAAVFDQVGDGTDFQPVLAGEAFQIGQAGHGAVGVHHFADHSRGFQPGERGEVAARFGMAGAHQHTAFGGHERKDVARLNDVAGLGVARHCRLHRARAIGGGNAGCHAFGSFDGRSERGAVRRAVVLHHMPQAELGAALSGEGQADQPACMGGHEVDRLRGDMLGGEHQVALVLAVFLIDQDDHAPGLELGDDVGNWGQGHGAAGLRKTRHCRSGSALLPPVRTRSARRKTRRCRC